MPQLFTSAASEINEPAMQIPTNLPPCFGGKNHVFPWGQWIVVYVGSPLLRIRNIDCQGFSRNIAKRHREVIW